LTRRWGNQSTSISSALSFPNHLDRSAEIIVDAANTRLAALAHDRAKTELKAWSGAIDRAAN